MIALLIAGLLASTAAAMTPEQKNGWVPTAKYDWWWHSLLARSESTGEVRPFFFEYYIVNPIGMPRTPRVPVGADDTTVPSYAMMMAGTTDPPPASANGNLVFREFFGRDDYTASIKGLQVTLGTKNGVTETHAYGSVSVSEAEAARQSRYLTTAGSMSWNLTAQKLVHFDAGYPTDILFRGANTFQMYWHVQGMVTRYAGTIVLNGERFVVDDKVPLGYQDKNWGTGYTNPWVWLNCNHLVDAATGQLYDGSGFLLGGGNPIVSGISLGRKALAAMQWDGRLHEFNFANLLSPGDLTWSSGESADGKGLVWDAVAENDLVKIVVHTTLDKALTLLVRYDEPAGGKIKHQNLWNGGLAAGTISVTDKKTGTTTNLLADYCGCEHGAY